MNNKKKLSLNDTVKTMVALAQRKRNFDAHFSEAEFHTNQDALFNAILENIGNVPAKFRKEAVNKWVEKEFEIGAYDAQTFELRPTMLIAIQYKKCLDLQKRIDAISVALERKISRMVQGMVLNIGTDEFVVKNLSVSGNQKKAQLTFLYENKPMTRHLQFRDGAWYGIPPAHGGLFGFVKYELTSLGI